MITVIIIFKLIFLNLVKSEVLTYDLAIQKVKNAEEFLMTGGRLNLSAEERLANDILIKYKIKEIENGIKNPELYAPGLHFFKAKELIERSEIYKFIKWLPKGSLLHGHSKALISSEWIIKNITYYPNLKKCFNDKGVLLFTFKNDSNNNCVLINDERNNSTDIQLYDKELEKTINLFTRYPEIEYSNINIVWKKFQNMFKTMSEVTKYLPIFKKIYKRILEEAYEDNIMYLEIRTSFGNIYDESGKTYSLIESAKILKKINEKFIATHQDFIGFKIIYAINRSLNSKKLLEKIEDFKKLYATFPEFIIGFDIVGQEDTGPPLYDFVNLMQILPPGVKFFFHAGETNWYGTSIDQNILDAILLNTTRIGHGYALLKHPVLWNTIKLRDIAIEINPLSNQILHLVNDLRNHPAAFYISEDIPIVISSDDPGFWNSKGLSYDFYYAFMCFTSSDSGIKVLKQLILNSIRYSIMTEDEKNKALKIFMKQWSTFIRKIIAENGNENNV